MKPLLKLNHILCCALFTAAPLIGQAQSNGNGNCNGNGQSNGAGQDQNRYQDNQVGGALMQGYGRPPIHVIVDLTKVSQNASKSSGGSSGSGTPPATGISGFTPAQIRHAYGFDQLTATGAGQTIAVVDAYGDPTIQADLNAFDSMFGVASATVTIAYSGTAPTAANSSWAMETALDVEWAHAVAPGAKILLVVTPTASVSDLVAGIDYAVSHGAKIVTMSWGAGEFSGETAYDYHFNVPGVAFTAPSGDYGASVSAEWPAASPFVIGVGGTILTLSASNTRQTEVAWSGSGGGISLYEPAPLYQKGWTGSSKRCVPDVSYAAAGSYQIYQGGKWIAVGGTSAAAPQWAALIALSNSARATAGSSLNSPSTALYSAAGIANAISAAYYYDVTSGSDGTASIDYAKAGYDYVTGLGTPAAAKLVSKLATY